MPDKILTDVELGTISNRDRLLPVQPALCKLFRGNGDQLYERLEALLSSIQPFKHLEEKWSFIQKPAISYFSLGSDLNTLYFYSFLIKTGGFKNILELGSYIGISTMFLAEAVGKKGKVTSIEIADEFYLIANENIKRNELDLRVELLKGDVKDIVEKFALNRKKFDFILIDAAKEKYGEMFTFALECLEPTGLIVIDDIFMNGDTLNEEPETDKGKGVRSLLYQLKEKIEDLIFVILPIGNGILLCSKK